MGQDHLFGDDIRLGPAAIPRWFLRSGYGIFWSRSESNFPTTFLLGSGNRQDNAVDIMSVGRAVPSFGKIVASSRGVQVPDHLDSGSGPMPAWGVAAFWCQTLFVVPFHDNFKPS